MITLNTNKGLIKIEDWADIEFRPGFVKDLNPTEHKLSSIIGRYSFKEKIKCGLSNCHTLHGKGYIAATTDGQETNIGKDCGVTYFGVDFETLSKKFDRDITEAENRERLRSFSFRIEELECRISELRNSTFGADWVYRHTRPLVHKNKGCPEEIVHRISYMVKTGSNMLSIQRKANEQEIEDIEAMQNRKGSLPRYIDVPIAEIAGIEVLYPENDLRDLLVLDLEKNLKEFRKVDIDTLTYEGLKRWAKWIDSIDNTIEKAISAMSQGRKLLNSKNLEPFLKVLNTQGDNNIFRGYLRGLNEGYQGQLSVRHAHESMR